MEKMENQEIMAKMGETSMLIHNYIIIWVYSLLMYQGVMEAMDKMEGMAKMGKMVKMQIHVPSMKRIKHIE